MNTLSCVKISFRRSFTYLKKNVFEYCWAKVKNMKKIWPQKFLRERGARVGILIGCDRDAKLWSTYTHRTFWAITWINYNFWNIWSKLAKDRVGQFGRLQYPDMFWPPHTLVPRCKLLAYFLLNFDSSKMLLFWGALV